MVEASDNKVKELEDELKVLKAEIRTVLLDMRDFMLEQTNPLRSEEHTSELQSHSFISYAVFCLKKKI